MNIFLRLLEKLVGFIVDLILSILSFPVFPAEVSQAVEVVFEWLFAGLGIVNFFCPLTAIAPGIIFVLLVFGVEKMYHFTMWILKKIPFVGVE